MLNSSPGLKTPYPSHARVTGTGTGFHLGHLLRSTPWPWDEGAPQDGRRRRFKRGNATVRRGPRNLRYIVIGRPAILPRKPQLRDPAGSVLDGSAGCIAIRVSNVMRDHLSGRMVVEIATRDKANSCWSVQSYGQYGATACVRRRARIEARLLMLCNGAGMP